MPTLPPVPLVSKAVIAGTVGGTTWANIFHFLWDTAPTNTNMQELADQCFIDYCTNLPLNWSNGFTATSCITEDLSSSPALPGSHVGSATGTSSSSISAGTAMLVKHIIARRYRGGHPRTYMPPPGSGSMTDDDRWTTAVVTAQQGYFDDFIGTLLGHSFTANTLDAYVNVSYYSGGSLRVTPVVDVIAGSIVVRTVATQRRRIGR